MSTARHRFLELLKRDILELDAAELDFGIYRVLNHRRAAREAFLAPELPARITATLARLPGEATEDEEARVYNALYTFFSRYYDSGDFLPRQRRGKAGRYSVPYDGSDTHFHWATKGSHYVKSGERFAAYAYKQADGTRVRLVVQAASVARDNAKGAQRHYLPVALHAPGTAHPGEWRLAFEHRALTDAEAQAAGALRKPRGGASDEPAAAAADAPDADDAPAAEGASVQDRLVNAWFAKATLPKALDPALLQRHALRYAKGQSTDFFVHPQLGAFLRDELDQFLQTEFVHLWDVPDDALARERGKLAVARDIGRAIITVLAALEDLQAALFEKRTFVMQAHYLVMCSWLARQGAEGAALVARACKHAPQVVRWRQWLGEPAGSSASGAELLARCPHLPLDTSLFDEAFQWAVLAEVPDVQGALGGLLVHGDNYAALRTLQAQWREGVKCVYIDPPYNTGKDEFLYNDSLGRHGSWATMVGGRIQASRPLLKIDGALFTSIDHNERDRLERLLLELFGDDARIGEVIWHNVTDNNPTQIATEHEYVLCYGATAAAKAAPWKSSISSIKDLLARKGAELVAAHSNGARLQEAYRDWYRENKDSLGELADYKFIDEGGVYCGSRSVHNPGKEGYRYPVLHPQTGRPCKQPLLGYRFPEETMRDLISRERILFGVDESKIIELKVYAHEYEDKRSSVLTLDGRAGANELRSLFTGDLRFKNPKTVGLLEELVPFVANGSEVVLDYFAGSGTTAHAVINLNRDDGGTRRFILVEQGEYFDTVTLPRVAKVMACPEWKDGRPKDGVAHHPAEGDDADEHWAARTLPIVQVLRIERYEDSLDALALPGAAAEGGQTELAGFDALLRYVADTVADAQAPTNPVRLSTAALKRPLHYRLPTVWEGQAVERPVDLLHTTLLLLGLHLVRVRHLQRPPAAGGGAALLAEVRPHRPGQPAAAVPLELLLLREHDLEDLPPAQQAAHARAEYDWLATAVQQTLGRTLASYACVHHNRDLLLPGDGEHGQSIDAALAAAMWQRDPAFSPPATAAVNATTGTPAALA
ncbi:MAG: site-specific DNA-methyltransferase [Betaproteobacteria bacterium]